jgi:hypothetical protein
MCCDFKQITAAEKQIIQGLGLTSLQKLHNQVLTHVAAATQMFERLIVFGLQLMAPLTVVSCSACEQMKGSTAYMPAVVYNQQQQQQQ